MRRGNRRPAWAWAIEAGAQIGGGGQFHKVSISDISNARPGGLAPITREVSLAK